MSACLNSKMKEVGIVNDLPKPHWPTNLLNSDERKLLWLIGLNLKSRSNTADIYTLASIVVQHQKVT